MPDGPTLQWRTSIVYILDSEGAGAVTDLEDGCGEGSGSKESTWLLVLPRLSGMTIAP